MSMDNVAQAWARMASVLERRPGAGLHDDPPATARWQDGTRIVTRHPSGREVVSDMAVELGGSGDQVSPGWLFRAGLAACTATRIAMGAARDGVALSLLEVDAASRSDTRGLFDMADADGRAVPAGPEEVQLAVRIAAPGVAPERLQALVEEGCRCSPIGHVVREALPTELRIEIAPTL